MIDRNVLLVAVVTAGCSESPLAAVQQKWGREETGMWSLRAWPELDVLVVVDDSASMAAEAPSVSTLLVGLLDPALPMDLRIGVTTTDAGSVACDEDSVEDGALVHNSCQERLPDFVTDGDVDGPAVDVRDAACLDVCKLDTLSLSAPWIEHRPDGNNLPSGVSFDAAVACMVPQGVSGCAFESPLESMRRAIERSMDPTAAEHGFLRDGASLLVVFVSDEDDCSVHEAKQALFDPDHPNPLWAGGAEPTSAACPRAAGAGLLQPIERYETTLRRLQEAALRADPRAEVMLASVVAVPRAYPNVDLEIEPPADDAEAEAFGVGASCREDDRFGYPPLRLLELANRFATPWATSSTCDEAYSAVLQLFAHCGLVSRPLCVPTCVAGIDAIESAPSCWLEHREGDHAEAIPRCERLANDWSLPTGAYVCWAPLTDKDGVTQHESDDMEARCIETGTNLQVRILGGASWSGGGLWWTCEPSEDPTHDCPDL